MSQKEMKVRKADMCWTCKFGRFDRKNGIGAVRYSGVCVFECKDRKTVPPTYKPPKAFWSDMRDECFANSYEGFLEENAPIYWPHRLLMEDTEKRKRIRYLKEDRLKREYKYMKWFYDNRKAIFPVLWGDVCDEHVEA